MDTQWIDNQNYIMAEFEKSAQNSIDVGVKYLVEQVARGNAGEWSVAVIGCGAPAKEAVKMAKKFLQQEIDGGIA